MTRLRSSGYKPVVEKHYPAPEIILPGAWEILDQIQLSDGTTINCTSMMGRKMMVPLAGTPEARCIRLHEMGHVKWSPGEYPPKVDKFIMLACEDYRINRLLDKFMDWDIRLLGMESDVPTAQSLSARSDWPRLACMLLARWGCEHSDAMQWEARAVDLHPQFWKIVDRARAFMDADPANFLGVVKATRYLMVAFDPPPPPPAPETPWDQEVEDGISGGGFEDEERHYKDKFDEKREGQRLEDLADEIEDEVDGGKLDPATNDGDPGPTSKQDSRNFKREKAGREPVWGKMEIQRPPLVKAFSHRLVGKKRRHRRSGAFVVSPGRLITDGRVFVSRSRQPGCSVLIDQSGSMGWTTEQIESIITEAPSTILAGYAGQVDSGILRIMVCNKRRVEDDLLKIKLGGNTVDFPALQWLAQQPEPRIWVSDGMVVPTNSSTGLMQEAWDQCKDLCRQAKIVRVDGVEETIELLRRIY